MSINWVKVQFKDVAEVITGNTPSTNRPDFYGNEIPFATPGDLDSITPVIKTVNGLTRLGAEQARLIPPNAVMVCCIGSLGKVGIAGTYLVTNQQINSLVFDEKKVFPRYGYHYCRTLTNLLNHIAPSTTVAIVNKSRFSSLELPLPPLNEQKRIAAILDKADALREKRRQAIAKLDTLLQSIFLDMFGDPVTNPKGWNSSSFGQEVSLLEYGPRFYNESYSPLGVRIVRITDLDSLGNLEFDSMPKMEVSSNDKKRYCLKAGDLVFARTGATVGKAALISEKDPDCIAGAYFIRMQFKETIHPLYARMVIASNSIQAIIATRSRQSAQQNFSGPGIRALPLPLPPKELQSKFHKIHAAISELANKAKSHLQSADQLFQSLQQRAFNGELFNNEIEELKSLAEVSANV